MVHTGETDRETDRQTYTGTHTDTQAGRHTDRHTHTDTHKVSEDSWPAVWLQARENLYFLFHLPQMLVK